MTRAFLIAGLCFSLMPVAADIAPRPRSGGVSLVVPGQAKTDIALVHNTVQMSISPSLCKTRAFFRLHNTGAPVTLEVGFPLVRSEESADFQVWIDEKPQTFEYREQEQTFNAGGRLRKSTQRWKLWPMSFQADQTRLVEVRYSNPPAPTSSIALGTLEYPSFRRWRVTGRDYDLQDAGYETAANLRDWLAIEGVSYILVSGSYWKGPIEKCRVEVELEDLSPECIVEVTPPAHSLSPSRLVWEWQNTEPARNVDITFVGAAPRSKTIPWLEKLVALHPEDPDLRTTLNAMREDFGEEKIDKRQRSFVAAAPK